MRKQVAYRREIQPVYARLQMLDICGVIEFSSSHENRTKRGKRSMTANVHLDFGRWSGKWAVGLFGVEGSLASKSMPAFLLFLSWLTSSDVQA